MQHEDDLPIQLSAEQIERHIIECQYSQFDRTSKHFATIANGWKENGKRQQSWQTKGEEHGSPGQLIGHLDRHLLSNRIRHAITIGNDGALFGIACGAKHLGMATSTSRLLYELHSNFTSLNFGNYPVVGNVVIHCFFGFSYLNGCAKIRKKSHTQLTICKKIDKICCLTSKKAPFVPKFSVFLLTLRPYITIVMAYIIYFIIGALTLISCGNTERVTASSQQGTATIQQKVVPSFSADSAYVAIAQQLDFGPRVPGSKAQTDCAEWLQQELKRFGADVKVQRTTVTAYDGTHLPCINIIGSYNPEARNRILLMSHWDSRHVADADADAEKRKLPVPAANDGASGVGILLEIARQAGLKQPNLGIDIFLTDAEDYGAPDDWKGSHDEKFWALGTQEWCKHPHTDNYQATYGILLDMVGSGQATFYREYYSDRYASDVVNLVWQTAAKMGYSNLFINRQGAGITDDHLFVNQMRHIPTIDIIDTRMHGDGTFYPHWHTTEDTLDKISKETLQKVGNVLMQIIY